MTKTAAKALALVAFLFLAFAIGYNKGKNEAQERIVTQMDTLFIRDTFVRYTPKETVKREVCKVYIKGDTVRLHDTLYIEAVREQREYRDTAYQCWVSGIAPALDSIRVFNERQIITRHEVKNTPCIGFSVQLGVGAQYGIAGRSFDFGPYLGVGLHYRFGINTSK